MTDINDIVWQAAADGDFIPVDSGHLLIVDPCHIPAALLRELIETGLATVVSTGGDGLFTALYTDTPRGPFIVIDRV